VNAYSNGSRTAVAAQAQGAPLAPVEALARVALADNWPAARLTINTDARRLAKSTGSQPVLEYRSAQNSRSLITAGRTLAAVCPPRPRRGWYVPQGGWDGPRSQRWRGRWGRPLTDDDAPVSVYLDHPSAERCEGYRVWSVLIDVVRVSLPRPVRNPFNGGMMKPIAMPLIVRVCEGRCLAGLPRV